MLDEKQIAFYREQGYIGVEGVFSPEETEELRQVTEEFVNDPKQCGFGIGIIRMPA